MSGKVLGPGFSCGIPPGSPFEFLDWSSQQPWKFYCTSDFSTLSKGPLSLKSKAHRFSGAWVPASKELPVIAAPKTRSQSRLPEPAASWVCLLIMEPGLPRFPSWNLHFLLCNVGITIVHAARVTLLGLRASAEQQPGIVLGMFNCMMNVSCSLLDCEMLPLSSTRIFQGPTICSVMGPQRGTGLAQTSGRAGQRAFYLLEILEVPWMGPPIVPGRRSQEGPSKAVHAARP